ncbi:MAG: hypothetical protein AAFQ57_14340, partial [Cyanobacteria bacterium J06626_14]
MALNPVADQFDVNQNQNFQAFGGSVASDRNGNYVIVWSSPGRDGSDDGIFGQRFRADGTRIGNEFQVNTTTQGSQRGASVGMDSNGNFVVSWFSDNPNANDPLAGDVYAQRFRADGSRLGSEFRVNDQEGLLESPALVRKPEIAVADNGNFTIVWQQAVSAFNDVTDIYARSFTSASFPMGTAGIPNGQAYLVNEFTTDYQVRPDVAVDRFGNAAITWESGGGFSRSDGPDGDKSSVSGRLFSSTGNARSNEFTINQTTVGRQSNPAIAMTANGNFVVTWVDYLDRGALGPNDPYRLLARQFNASANPTSQEIVVDSTPAGDQNSKVAIDDAGNFVVAWAGDRITGSGFDFDTLARRYLANGTPDTNTFEVPTVGTQYDGISEITSDPDGDIVILWNGTARQFSPRSVNRGGGGNPGGSGNPSGGGPIVGTASANVLRGTAAADVIRGLGGDDRLIGRGNNDRLIGGAGDDFLNGGGGNDIIRGNGGNDTMR